MPQVKAILFDVGNTLLEMDPNEVEVVADVLTKFGQNRITTVGIDRAMKQSFLYYDETIFPEVWRQGGWGSLGPKERWAVGLDYVHYILSRLDRVTPYGGLDEALYQALFRREHFRVLPGVMDVLTILSRRRLALGVVSNWDGTLSSRLRGLGLESYFRVIADSGVTGYEKPDPRAFLVALNALQVSPEETLFVGDELSTDVAGAGQAGIQAVHFDLRGTYADRGSLGCFYIRSYKELLELLHCLGPAGGT